VRGTPPHTSDVDPTTVALLHVMQFYAANVTTVNPTRTTCYTVPAGDRIVVRSFAVRNLSGTAGMTVYIWINGVVVHTIFLTTGGTAGDSSEWRPWLVLTPGQTIQMAVSAAAGVGAIVSGSLYTI
jgi:hypothetical protein